MAAKKETKVKADKGDVSLAATLKEIRDRFGADSIMTLSEKPAVDVDALSTGSIGLDAALGIGGLPRGRIIEIFGPESSGKTTLALHVVAEAHKRGEICAFVDAEHAMDPQYAKKLGVNMDKLLISQPGTGEEALQIVDQLVKSGKVSVIVVDSVAALTPKAIIEGEMGDVTVGALARLMSKSLSKLVGVVHKSNTIVIFINQIRANISSFGFGANPETTTGGKALKFYASVRLDIRMIASIKKGEEKVGSRVRIKVVKNKVAAPFKQTELDVLYNEGMSREGEILALAEKYGLIAKGGSYVYGEEKLGRGYDQARQYLKEHPDIMAEMADRILARATED